MSSILKKMNRKRGKKRLRPGTNTRGNKPGRAAKLRHAQGPGLRFLTKNHDLKHADPDCRICHGTGTKQTAYVQDGKTRLLACSCVPVVER